MPPDNLYPDEESSDHPQSAAEEGVAEGMEESGAESNTALVPKSLFGGKTPEIGDVCEFRITHLFEDEAEIEYVKHDDEKAESMDMKIEKLGKAM